MTSTAATPGASRNASPYLYGEEAVAVSRVLETGQYGHTDVTEEFERRIAEFLGVPDAVAVMSGTAALHAALLAAEVGPGHEVVVPSMTFCATAQVILAVGATPRFVDIDPATLCVTDQLVLDAVTDRTRAVMPVLFGGRAVDLCRVRKELAARNVSIIEDAAHAFGSRYDSRRVGATGDLTCFSFGPIKNLTCGQGGIVVPRTRTEADTVRRIRLLGVVQSQAERAQATSYHVSSFGLRYQMSSINAAIGLAQLPHFEKAKTTRRILWRAYRRALAPLDRVTLVDVDPDRSVPHLCQVRVPRRDKVFAQMQARGIGVGVHYPPNHLQPAFAQWRRVLPATEQVAGEILTLPFHQHLTETDIDQVVTTLGQVLQTVGAASCARS
ncbi:DegT/DnrJ/EryC1/StrS aminotransferase [Streptomyces yokosukanensis]|uniref:DegT/DnrJ/EryC1/StrS aminotransferase n=1 Tax=Streptomyces yokosukanensis TaxID=67386 RepID=A0A117PXI2_9ACTN|nr:DegT/DnrJ/EryC1/StrS family aminotransferase [Streptomyces yokosukanensis]KUM97353.1 DegT/DnrJ/EryC1/StrS aminotransferase [Streptomyces yokosukanensis]